jgi:hypothetical protein
MRDRKFKERKTVPHLQYDRKRVIRTDKLADFYRKYEKTCKTIDSSL